MIVPMKKISLLTMGHEKTKTLKALRSLGMMHIESKDGTSEKLGKLQDQLSSVKDALYAIGKAKAPAQKEADLPTALSLAEEIRMLLEEKKDSLQEKIALTQALESLKSWGDIDPDALTSLAEKGVVVSFYEMPKGEYKALDSQIKIIPLEKGKKSVKFMLCDTDIDGESQKTLEKYRLSIPKMSTKAMREKVQELSLRAEQIDQKLSSYAVYRESFHAAADVLQKEMEFELHAVGMTDAVLSAQENKTVSYFSGYIEADNVEKLKEAAQVHAWGLVISDPTEEDNVPTKLKNNKFVSLIYPLTDFLGTVPGYFEYDISAWFLGFILIFFGIIFGDGGYGLLITAVAAVPVIKALLAKKPVAPAFLLVGLFGLSTILWGTLTCTWFGLSPEQLPAWLKALSIPCFSNVYADKLWSLPWTPEGVGLTTAQNLQIFCFFLALVQLIVAHIKVAKRNLHSLKIFADIGNILQLLGMYFLVLNLVVNPAVFPFDLVLASIPVGTVCIVLIAIGFILSFIFSNYEGSIKKSILASLANIVTVLLGVVNVFSDIVSYIRLWAVGLAGGAISATVNELASPLLGNFMLMIFAIILLVFGHGLNMILNVLSVVVHGIRLNTLEFSTHLDMAWSGHKFKPFEE